MIQIINFIKNIFKKYDSLRQEPWTHWLILFTYLYVLPTTIRFIYLININNENLQTFFYFVVGILLPYYVCAISVCLIFGIINRFTKNKLKNNFFTQNKFYALYWHVGNILFLEFLIILFS